MFSLNLRCKPIWVWGESLYFNYKKKNKRSIIFDRPRLIMFKKTPVWGKKKKKNSLFCSQAPAAGHRCPPLPVSKGRSWSCSVEQQDYRGGKSSEAAAPSKDQVNVMLR